MSKARRRRYDSPGQLTLELQALAYHLWRPLPIKALEKAKPEPEPKPKPKRSGPILTRCECPRQRRREGLEVQRHIPLLKTIIRQQRSKFSCIEIEDLYSLGLIGLLKAVKKYDEKTGYKFSTIALPFILGEWRHYVRDRGFWLKAPASVRQRGMQARRLMERGMSAQEVGEKLGVSLEDVRLALRATSGMGHELGDFELHSADVEMDSDWL